MLILISFEQVTMLVEEEPVLEMVLVLSRSVEAVVLHLDLTGRC